MTDPLRWTTATQVADAVRRRWTDGTLLRAVAAGEECPRIEVPLRAPSAVDLGDHFDAAVAWSDALRRGSRDGRAFDLESTRTGGRVSGRSEVPSRAVVRGFDQAWRLLGVSGEVDAFRTVLAQSAEVPDALAWATDHPLAAVALAPEWAAVLAARRWLADHRGSGLHLRQVSAPGVDTKFVERHRGVLAALLGVPTTAGGFLSALGLSRKPQTVRLRVDPQLALLPDGVTEATFRAEELGALEVRPSLVTIVENEITYLSVPVPRGGLVVWGRGFDVEPLRALLWLADAPVTYWGDLDTHGFAILDRVRAFLPQTESILMDRDTLLAHEARWVREPQPTAAALQRLTRTEQALYVDLVSDGLGHAVRLEQERIDWGWAAIRLSDVRPGAAPAEQMGDL